jgi:hypothetical protein
MPVETPPNADTVPDFKRSDEETPPATRPAPARTVDRRPTRPRLARRPTPAEQLVRWATWSKTENARQALEAKEKATDEALAELRARRAGLPWPPDAA